MGVSSPQKAILVQLSSGGHGGLVSDVSAPQSLSSYFHLGPKLPGSLTPHSISKQEMFRRRTTVAKGDGESTSGVPDDSVSATSSRSTATTTSSSTRRTGRFAALTRRLTRSGPSTPADAPTTPAATSQLPTIQSVSSLNSGNEKEPSGMNRKRSGRSGALTSGGESDLGSGLTGSPGGSTNRLGMSSVGMASNASKSSSTRSTPMRTPPITPRTGGSRWKSAARLAVTPRGRSGTSSQTGLSSGRGSPAMFGDQTGDDSDGLPGPGGLARPPRMIGAGGASTESEGFARSGFAVGPYTETILQDRDFEELKDHAGMLADLSSQSTAAVKSMVSSSYDVFIDSSAHVNLLASKLVDLRANVADMATTIQSLQSVNFNYASGTNDSVLFALDEDFGRKSGIEGESTGDGVEEQGINQMLRGRSNRAVMEGADAPEKAAHLLRRGWKDEQRRSMAASMAWLLKAPDDLDVYISERRFDLSVDLIERVQASTKNQAVANAARPLLDAVRRKTSYVASVLLHDLDKPGLSKTESRRVIGYLLRLDYHAKARDVFLQARSKYIHQSTRKIRFEGDIKSYVEDLSRTVFTALVLTMDDFHASFHDHNLMSGFVVWLTAELSRYADLFKAKVFAGNNTELADIGAALAIARNGAKMLEQSGCSMWHVLRLAFIPPLEEALVLYYNTHIEAQIFRKLGEETWLGKEFTIAGAGSGGDGGDGEKKRKGDGGKSGGAPPVMLTTSAHALYTSVKKFVWNVGKVLQLKLYPALVDIVSTIFETYLGDLTERMSDPDQPSLTDQQALSLLADAHHVVTDLLPRVTQALQNKFDRPIAEFDRLRRNLERIPVALQEDFCQLKGMGLGTSISLDYSNAPETLADNAEPSPSWHSVFVNLYTVFRPLLDKYYLPSEGGRMFGLMVYWIVATLNMRLSNETVSQWGPGGLNAFVLDLRYFEAMSGVHMEVQDTRAAHQELLMRALAVYRNEHDNADLTQVLRSDDWFEERREHAKKRDLAHMGRPGRADPWLMGEGDDEYMKEVAVAVAEAASSPPPMSAGGGRTRFWSRGDTDDGHSMDTPRGGSSSDDDGVMTRRTRIASSESMKRWSGR